MTDCPICLSPLSGHALFTTTCGHTFHFDCIKQSVKIGPNTLCPLCRNNVPQLVSGGRDGNSGFMMGSNRMVNRGPSLHTSRVLFDGPSLLHPTMDDFEEQPLIPQTPINSLNNPSLNNPSLTLELISEYQTIISEMETMDVVARVSAVGTQHRAPVDIVAVIDKSASMKGEKITLVKHILQFILSQLNEHDRLSIITFDKQVYGVFGLNQCSQYNQSNVLKDRIMNSEYLVPSGGTNIKAGLERGLRVLTERHEQNPITAMLLLTDGMGTIPSDEELNELPPIPIHCFGIGTDHDARVLNKIAEQTNGSYVFIEQAQNIRDSIALCLGSLLSIMGQEIKITITALNMNVKTSYPFTCTPTSATITIPNILFEEHKDILFNCQIPNNQSNQPIELCSVTGSYRDPSVEHGMNERIIDEVHHIILRGSEQNEPRLDVDRERNRILGISALKDAVAYGEMGELEEARTRLSTTITEIKNSLTATDPGVQIIILDLEMCLERFQDNHTYDTSGYAFAEQQYRSHSFQRSVNTSTPSSYLTKSQSRYVN